MSNALTRISSLDLRSVIREHQELSQLHPVGYGYAAESKAAVPAPVNAQPVNPAYALFLSPQEITPYYAWLLYQNVAPLAKVVDLIADNVAGLDPLVMVDGEPATTPNKLTAFLSNPGWNRTRRRLIKEMVIQELITGTCYLCTQGNVEYDPARLDIYKSQYISPVQGVDMWPATYLYNEGTRSDIFQRLDGHNMRWISQTGMAELTPIYSIDGNRRGIGLSKLTAIKADVELRMKGTEHNSAMMDNGARPTAIANFKTGFTPEQARDVGRQIRNDLAGSQNAGKVLITGGGEMQFEQLSLSPKDMDWSALVKFTEDAIVQRFNVPGPLFNNEAQTDNNYETAWNMFYDNAVLPEFDVIWSGIGRMLSERAGAEITFKHDALTNNILARQAAARANDLHGGNLITTNEARTIIGYQAMPGGDFTANPMMGQVGDDYFTDDEVGQPRRIQAPKPDEEDGAPGKDKAKAEKKARSVLLT